MNRRSMFSKLFGGLVFGAMGTDVKPKMKLLQANSVKLEPFEFKLDEEKLSKLIMKSMSNVNFDLKTGKMLLTIPGEADTIWDTVDTSTSG